MEVTELVLEIKRITDHSISRIFGYLFSTNVIPLGRINLNKATCESRTPVFIYQFGPI